MDKILYEVTVKNDVLEYGTLYASTNRQLSVAPSNDGENDFNAGELLAFSWSTCLGGTLGYVLKTRQLEVSHHIDVTFKKKLDMGNPRGYHFFFDALIKLGLSDQNLIDDIVKETHQRCPISKLLKKEFVTLKGMAE
jgi:lipoyl-dependent peroxiredoxin